ncbi:MAG: DUF3320 domain-containing protein [Chloroflexia bacterium]|nr:DUF3320 domain-containing protein [Chloroflexia bacterium]
MPYRIAALPKQEANIFEVSSTDMATIVVRCVDVGGPIHRDLLTRRILDSWGYRRSGVKLNAHISLGIAKAAELRRISFRGEFCWPSPAGTVIPRGASSEGWLREIGQIPEEEIIEGIVTILERAYSLTEDELLIHTTRLFGFQRTGSDIVRRVTAAIRLAKVQERLQDRNGWLQLSEGKRLSK